MPAPSPTSSWPSTPRRDGPARPFFLASSRVDAGEIEEGASSGSKVDGALEKGKGLALAIRFDQLIRDGVVTDQAELARLGHVSRARLTQIMNLLNLAPDIFEALFILSRRRIFFRKNLVSSTFV